MMLRPRYRDFKEQMQVMFQLQWGGDPPIKYPVDVVLEIVMPGTDADALNKPIFDALEAAGVLADDKLIRNYAVLTADRQAPAHTCEIIVRICEHSSRFQEALAKLAGREYESVMRESRQQAETEAEDEEE